MATEKCNEEKNQPIQPIEKYSEEQLFLYKIELKEQNEKLKEELRAKAQQVVHAQAIVNGLNQKVQKLELKLNEAKQQL